MREVILHIGMHKTGSSSIQVSLKGFDDGITRYANFENSNHSIPIYTIFSNNRHDYHIWKKQGLSPAEVDSLRTKYLKELEIEMSDSSWQRLIISGEDISVLESHEKLDLIEFLEARECKVKVICFARGPHEFASSILQTLVKGGSKSVGPAHPAYQERIGFFLERLAKENVVVEGFERNVSECGDIVKAFSRIIGISAPSISRENEALSESALKAVYRLNLLPIETSGSPQRARARLKFIEFVSRSFPAGHEFHKPDKLVTGRICAPSTFDDVLFLKSNFGISYDVPDQNTDIDAVHAYLNDINDLDTSRLRTSLASASIDFLNSGGIDSLLIGLYHHFLFWELIGEDRINYLRDLAIKIERNTHLTIEDAYEVMRLAHLGRPNGAYIKRKIQEYSAQIHADEPRDQA